MRHVPGLDGLRGLAVAGVLLFHAEARLRGGFLGVDLFFVLSGYLITTLLVEEQLRSAAIDLRAFWIRRARRLMPALLSLMPAVALYAKLFAKPAELGPLRSDALATLAYVANWRAVVVHRSYWDLFLSPSPLEHTWSLAIEEQFYVLWPLLVVGLFALNKRRAGTRVVFFTSLGLALASMLAMTLLYEGPGGNTTRVYLGTDTRGAAILLGAALATSGLARPSDGPTTRPRLLDALGVAAVAVLGVAWLRLDGQSEWLYRGGFWVTELAALVLIVSAVRRPTGLVARALSLRPLRWLGAISYGVYLWHWPIYVVLTDGRVHASGLRLLALRLIVTLVIATLSYGFFEQPIRRRGLRWGRPVLVVPGAVLLVSIIVLATTRNVDAHPAPLIPPLMVAPALPVLADAAPPFKVLVVGDSVGIALGGRMGWDGKPEGFDVEQRAVGDCSILEDIVPVHSMSGDPHGNPNCAGSWVADAQELHPDVLLVVIGGAYFSSVKVDGRWRKVCTTEWHDAYVKRLSALLHDVAPYTKRRSVLLAAYPVGKWQTPTRNDDVDCFNRILRDAANDANADVLDLNAFACPDRRCTLVSKGQPVRPDGLHFDGQGAEDTSHWVLDRLRP